MDSNQTLDVNKEAGPSQTIEKFPTSSIMTIGGRAQLLNWNEEVGRLVRARALSDQPPAL